MSINIAGLQPIDDPEYRYKMPRLQCKIEGRGNGIKTVVVNCVDLATSLHRSAPEVIKFFGCELGAQSKFDAATERAIVNGQFDSVAMQQHLSKYIENFVLCPACRLPESKYKFKGQCIFHRCYACGAVEPIDMNHKLTTFILKEHATSKRNKAKDKDGKKKRREKKGDDEGSPKSEDKKKKKEKKDKDKEKEKEKKEKKRKSKEKIVEDDVEWHTDLSKEAVAQRAAEAKALEAAAQKAIGDDEEDDELVATLENCEIDDEEAIENALTSLRKFLDAGHSINEVVVEVSRLQTFAALPVTDRLRIFFFAAFDGDIIKSKQIAKYADVLSNLVCTSEDQYRLISFCEELCVTTQTPPYKIFPIVLKFLYDEDILEEESVLAWDQSNTREQYRTKKVSEDQGEKLLACLRPFIDWLENAEEESDEE